MRFTYLFFSLLLCLSSYAQPNPINRRAMAIAGLASVNPDNCLSGAPVYPTNVAGLKLWVEADKGVFSDAGTTPAVNGDTVQQWNDQSTNGNNLVQSSAGQRPKYNTAVQNGLPVVGFTNKWMDRTYSGALSQPLTYFIVYQVSTGTGDPGYIIDGAGANYAEDLEINGGILMVDRSAGGNLAVHPSTYPKNTWFFDVLWFSGANSTFMTNGLHSNFTNTLGTATVDSIRLGDDHFAPEQPGTFKLAELIIFNAYLTTSDACGISTYLKNKWGL